MTNTTLSTTMAPLSPPTSPRLKPKTPSPRSVTQENTSSILGIVNRWKRGEIDIDTTVQELISESSRRKSFSREVYMILSKEVRAEPNQKVLIDSRKALYAASVFSRMAGLEEDYRTLENSFIQIENILVKEQPGLFV